MDNCSTKQATLRERREPVPFRGVWNDAKIRSKRAAAPAGRQRAQGREHRRDGAAAGPVPAQRLHLPGTGRRAALVPRCQPGRPAGGRGGSPGNSARVIVRDNARRPRTAGASPQGNVALRREESPAARPPPQLSAAATARSLSRPGSSRGGRAPQARRGQAARPQPRARPPRLPHSPGVAAASAPGPSALPAASQRSLHSGRAPAIRTK